MSYVMELQSNGEILETAYPRTIKGVMSTAKRWARPYMGIRKLAQPQKKIMLAAGGQMVYEMRKPDQSWDSIYVTCDPDTMERFIERTRWASNRP